ncbi:MAG: hypothetical protein JL50_06205 [Peptococcaceae bacterium BICA1-7]|nr:MAG: hypothetical protein JL50_06205 [Peptococcaceae bacterium BICA1-7]HBV96181.1 hypothetical protein [Desulfotomaculum sp.]
MALNTQTPWLSNLMVIAEKKPIVVLRFGDEEWEFLQGSRRGLNEFTIARPHSLLKGVSVPTPCLIQRRNDACEHLYFGLISSRSAVTTLETRIKIRRVARIKTASNVNLIQFISEKPHAQNLKERLRSAAPIVILSPKLSSHLVEKLVSVEENRGPMRAITESLTSQKRFLGAKALQEDAIHTALKVFGLTLDDPALALELVEGRETALARVGIMEDSVIEHDARYISDYKLVKSDLTGHAVFKKGDQRLEVYTANRRSLEKALGVDLIYLNVTRQNIVMLQYKMLEPQRDGLDTTDWIYRPDAKLEEELGRMRKFIKDQSPGLHEYRFNPGVFYLKFVKRNGLIRNGGIITPIDHFEKIRTDPAFRGPKKGLRVSYKSLSGHYLRESAFLDLVKSGYIGGYAETTAYLKTLVDAVLKNGRAVVAAIQQSIDTTVV